MIASLNAWLEFDDTKGRAIGNNCGRRALGHVFLAIVVDRKAMGDPGRFHA